MNFFIGGVNVVANVVGVYDLFMHEVVAGS